MGVGVAKGGGEAAHERGVVEGVRGAAREFGRSKGWWVGLQPHTCSHAHLDLIVLILKCERAECVRGMLSSTECPCAEQLD